MKQLPDVTLFVLTSVKFEAHIEAMQKSMEHIQFGEALFISHQMPSGLVDQDVIGWSHHDRMNNMKEWNHACIYDLHKYIHTSHCLFIHDDSWVINPEMWDDSWLEYDYIGAPWKLRDDDTFMDPFGTKQRVGNGGFSLRSKFLLEVPLKTHVPFEVNDDDFYRHMNAGLYNEDGNICVHNRHIFEREGCKFAPVDVAARFSHEEACDEITGIRPFGFHKHRIHTTKIC